MGKLNKIYAGGGLNYLNLGRLNSSKIYNNSGIGASVFWLNAPFQNNTPVLIDVLLELQFSTFNANGMAASSIQTGTYLTQNSSALTQFDAAGFVYQAISGIQAPPFLFRQKCAPAGYIDLDDSLPPHEFQPCCLSYQYGGYSNYYINLVNAYLLGFYY